MDTDRPMYRRIYDTVMQIPRGRVATYGQVARLAGRCSARNVGYAMSSVPPESMVPWHRVINGRGMISARSDGNPCEAQRRMLESEGVEFDAAGSVYLAVFGWRGPDHEGFGGE